MNRILIALTLTCLSARSGRAQSEVNELPLAQAELPQISPLQVTPPRQSDTSSPESPRRSGSLPLWKRKVLRSIGRSRLFF